MSPIPKLSFSLGSKRDFWAQGSGPHPLGLVETCQVFVELEMYCSYYLSFLVLGQVHRRAVILSNPAAQSLLPCPLRRAAKREREGGGAMSIRVQSP